MNKYVLPPRVKLANNLLLFYLVLSALVSAYVAIISPLYIVLLMVQAGMAVAVFFKWPMAYLVLMCFSFCTLVLSLHGARLIESGFSVLMLWLAFYIRSNLYLRRADAAAVDATES